MQQNSRKKGTAIATGGRPEHNVQPVTSGDATHWPLACMIAKTSPDPTGIHLETGNFPPRARVPGWIG
jgi:hypothetical protein